MVIYLCKKKKEKKKKKKKEVEAVAVLSSHDIGDKLVELSSCELLAEIMTA